MSAPASVNRLLAGLAADRPLALAEHERVHGPLPAPGVRRGPDEALVRTVEASGLLGRGGAGFPAGRKLRTVAAGRRPVVVANGAEGEPASRKDGLLLARSPHLVLDGIQVAARAVGSTQCHLVLHRAHAALPVVRAALAERRDRVEVSVHELPLRYVASEASALVHWLNGGDAKPTFAPPPTYERGVDGRATLVNNVETLAHLGLIARRGADWYREVGDPDEPGTLLLTVCLPRGSQVLEVATGTRVGDVLEPLGVTPDTCGAVLVGGYYGTWMSREQVWSLPLTHYAMRGAGGSLGAGLLAPVPSTGACGLAEAARVIAYLAGQSAGQCGPCLNGLPAIARAMDQLAFHARAEPALGRWLSVVPGRGACGLPDGATRMVASALATFAAEAEAHLRQGPCAASRRPGMLPIPAAVSSTSRWR